MLAILDYDAGNIESVRLALTHVGGKPEFAVTAEAAAKADRLVFPGVGSAAQCMRNLRSRGFDKVLAGALARGKPVLAICIGMQLLFDSSEEDGGVEALGLLPGKVRRLTPPPGDAGTKIPHMGWNHVATPRPHPLLPDGLAGGNYYFVHSYYVDAADAADVYGATDYAGANFAALAGRDSLFAAQFHPEKSGETGLDMLERFIRWDGKPC